jgi:phosphonate transport system permease protein
MTAPQLPAAAAVDRAELLASWPRPRARPVVVGLIALAVYGWGVGGTDIRPDKLVSGLPAVADFISRLFPPMWKTEPVPIGSSGLVVAVPEVLFAIVETIQMAIVGTSLAVIISLPFGLLAARNTSPHRMVYQAVRLLLNLMRAVPDLVLALMFVAAVGLGPFAGVLALALGAVGFMGKLYAEAIEAIEPEQVLAVSATGASRAQTFVYAVLPQALPLVASYSLLLFETNVRSASVLGIVGAGGVGFVLGKYMGLFQYRYLVGALLLIVIAVTCIDRCSDAIRRRLL